MNLDSKKHSLKILYDRACPFCNKFATYLKLKNAFKSIELIDVRSLDSKELRAIFKTYNLNINDGFILIYKDMAYQGVQALIFLENLNKNKLSKAKIFFYKSLAFRCVIYPFLKLLRKILLFYQGSRINIDFWRDCHAPCNDVKSVYRFYSFAMGYLTLTCLFCHAVSQLANDIIKDLRFSNFCDDFLNAIGLIFCYKIALRIFSS